MDYTLHVFAEYIEAVVNGEFDVVDAKACIDAAFKLCAEKNIARVLVNGRGMSDRVSFGSRFSLGEYLARQPNQRVRVAIITSTKLVLESKTLQNTANNRGASVITTDSMEEARKFLGISEP